MAEQKVCKTPEYHETFAYCPTREWRAETLRERMEQHGALVFTKNMGADIPIFHHLLESEEGEMLPVCDETDTQQFWSSLHVKHASKIGAACRVCFPPTR